MEVARSGRGVRAWMVALLWVLLRVQHGAAARGSGHAAASGVYLDFRSVVNCPDKKSSVSNFSLTSNYVEKSRVMLFTGFFDVDRPAQSYSSFSFTFHKCKSGVPCEYRGAWVFKNNVCSEMVSPLAFWSSVIRSITPPIGCPTKKGRYLVTNATNDMKMVAQLVGKEADPDTTWHDVTLQIDDEQKRSFACVKEIFRIIPLSKRKDKA